MTRRQLLALLAAPKPQGTPPPNVVLILADDLGWADLACYGSRLHNTPHLDALARTGMRFTNAYSPSPVCTPTRASLLTGKHPARLGITIWHEGAKSQPTNLPLLPAPSEPNLPQSEITLAETLRDSGYSTALIGKWHLGDAGHYPETQGFDINIGGTFWGAPPTYFAPYRGLFNRELRYVPGLNPAPSGEYLTDRLTTESLGVIDKFSARRQPFFLYLAHHTPHTPIEAKSDVIARYEKKLAAGLPHTNATYAAMVESLDDSVGRILAHLRRQRLDRNTIFIFSSDNGGYLSGSDGRRITSNAPLRSGKGSLYEGGIRVPLLIHWPGRTTPGAVSHEPVVLTDLFPTLCQATGAQQPTAANDGLSLLPLLANPTARLPRESLHFHYPHYYPTTTPVSSIRSRDWKLLEYFEDNRLELFNLANDPSEAKNLASAEPARATSLHQQLKDWRTSVGARLPRPNQQLIP